MRDFKICYCTFNRPSLQKYFCLTSVSSNDAGTAIFVGQIKKGGRCINSMNENQSTLHYFSWILFDKCLVGIAAISIYCKNHPVLHFIVNTLSTAP